MPKITGAQAVVECLKLEGVRCVFGIPGGQTLSITNAIYDSPGMSFVATRHEGGAAHAADGWGRVTGTPGVCLATTGPGATNLITGVGGAFRDSSPMIVLTCQNNKKDIGRDDAQDADHVALFRSLTKWSTFVPDARQIPEIMREAFRVALGGRPGPVHIDLARDVLEQETLEFEPVAPANYRVKAVFSGEPGKVAEAAGLLAAARRPAIWVGNGVKLSGAGDEVLELAELLQAPVITTFNGIGAVPTTNELVFGPRSRSGTQLNTEILSEADLVLVIGSSLTGPTTSRWRLSLTRNLIQIDVNDKNIGKHYPFSVGVVGDAKLVLRQLIAVLSGKCEGDAQEARRGWVSEIQERKRAWEKEIYRADFDTASPIKPQTLMRRLGEWMARDAILSVDAGNPGIWSHLLPMHGPTTYMKPVNFGNMAFALPAGIAAKLAQPEREVIVLVGDGSLGMCLGEIETAVRAKTPLVIVLMNDRAYGNIKQEQLHYFGPRYIGVDFTDAKYAEVARSLGADGERIQRPEEIIPALNRARAAQKPYLVDVLIDPSESVWEKPF